MTIEKEKQAIITTLDDRIAKIYAKYQRFAIEYQMREEQAKAFKSANYTGETPSQIKAYQLPMGITPKQACDNILSQAEHLRYLLDKLGVIRMKKCAIRQCDNLEDLKQLADSVFNQLAAIEDIS